jgi:hypothetical protein
MLAGMLHCFLYVAGGTIAALLLGTGVLHLLPRLGGFGRAVSAAFCRAPLLDIPITYFTALPLIVGPIVGGWAGLGGAIVGQVLGVLAWTALHELANRKHTRGPRIVKVLNRIVGPLQNHAALWVTAIVTPLFWLVRVAEVAAYPALVWLVGFPKYRHADWVNVSRQKFSGLVGHDLIWCLYCDWMTGVWSLGSEMLRNVEAFWCPIRFHSEKKCVNCVIDFPDVESRWVPPTGNIADAAAKVEEMYGNGQMPRAWFGHPTRITVKGKPVVEERETVGV